MSDDPRTLRDRMVEAADGDEKVVDRLLARQVRGSAQIAGIHIPKTRCPAWQRLVVTKHGRSEDDR